MINIKTIRMDHEINNEVRIGVQYAIQVIRNLKIMKIISDAITEFNMKVSIGYMLLYKAISIGRIEVVELLLDYNADGDCNIPIHTAYGDWNMLIHAAATYGQKEIVELMLSRGADVNVRNKYGQTPLHYATWNCHKEAIKLLISYGADVNAKNHHGKTPYDLARSNEIKNLLRVL